MAYSTECPETTGSIGLGVKGTLPGQRSVVASGAVVPSKQASLVAQTPESNDLMRLVDQAEALMHEHFQQIRDSLRQLHGGSGGLPKGKNYERQAVEQLLQMEREQMAQQRALEQEQLRATMQQLAEAWLRLEQEQTILVESGAESVPVVGQPSNGSTPGSAWWSNSEPVIAPTHEPATATRSTAEMDSPRRPSPMVAMDLASSEELFHKLRIDLQRHVK